MSTRARSAATFVPSHVETVGVTGPDVSVEASTDASVLPPSGDVVESPPHARSTPATPSHRARCFMRRLRARAGDRARAHGHRATRLAGARELLGRGHVRDDLDAHLAAR